MALYAAQRYTGTAVKVGLNITAASGRTKRRSNLDVIMPSDCGGRIVRYAAEISEKRCSQLRRAVRLPTGKAVFVVAQNTPCSLLPVAWQASLIDHLPSRTLSESHDDTAGRSVPVGCQHDKA